MSSVSIRGIRAIRGKISAFCSGREHDDILGCDRGEEFAARGAVGEARVALEDFQPGAVASDKLILRDLAEVDGFADVAADGIVRLRGLVELPALGADRHRHLRAGRRRMRRVTGDAIETTDGSLDCQAFAAVGDDRARQEIRFANKICDRLADGTLVDFARRADLQDVAAFEDKCKYKRR